MSNLDFPCSNCDQAEYVCECRACSNCDELTALDDGRTSEENDFYCFNCYDDHFAECEDCNEEVVIDDRRCSSCDENYFYCARCDEEHHYDHSYYSESRGQRECENCYTDDEYCEFIERYHYEPYCGLVFHGEGSLFFGLEVEIEFSSSENRYDYLSVLNRWTELNFKSLHHFVIPQSDGSLSEECGVELVFQPQTIEELTKNFSNMPYPNKRNILDQDGVGIHVNISRDGVSDKAWGRFIRFIYENKAFWIEESERLQEGWAAYSETMNLNLEDPIFPRDKYTAVRVGYDRLEVRTFKSQMTREKLLSVTKLCYDLVRFCEALSNAEYVELSKNSMLLKSFKHFRIYGSPLKVFFANPYTERVLLIDTGAKVFEKTVKI